MRLEGKTAIVTGGSRGIGRACVAQLASEGAKVALVDLSEVEEAAQALAEEWRTAPGQIRAFQADVRDGQRAEQLVEQLLGAWERLDVLVNSAGIVRDGRTYWT
jgi:3-oxoacyl-[acyl-carrier protein] reductase